MTPTALADEMVVEAPPKKKRRSTSHLKMVPPEREIRDLFKRESEAFAKTLDKSRPFTKDQLEGFARSLLKKLDQPEGYLGFAMVLIGNYYWKQQFLTIPYNRRMLLLPHCLKNAEGCPAEYDEFGLNCEKCGACSIADYKVRAEQLGYKVLVAEGSPVVLKLIVSGYIDGILGVACLNVLEKAIDKVLLAGVPSFAVPLHSGDCKNTKMDEDWIWEVLEQYEPESSVKTSSYVPLLRAGNDVFDKDLETLAPRQRLANETNAFAAVAETEAIAYEYLANGGKRFRPFLTLAAYDVLARASQQDSIAADAPTMPPHVLRAAAAIEAFHKASLVHDDLEDDDDFRYGKATLHTRYDVGTAVNVGDYLVGMGYRLISQDRKTIGANAAADILDRLADAHAKLAEGQGAELAWRRSENKILRPIDALSIYALKTSPAFEAALFAGCRLAGEVPYADKLALFARHLGVGFQILNDLKDWSENEENKLLAGQDAIQLRPTLLLSLALDAAKGSHRETLLAMLRDGKADADRALTLRRIYEDLSVFTKAEKLVEKSRERCEAVADELEPESFRELLYYVVDNVLAFEKSAAESPGLAIVAG